MGIGMTIGAGLLGSFAAGLFSWFVLHRHGAGLVLSVVFSMLIVYALRRSGAARRCALTWLTPIPRRRTTRGSRRMSRGGGGGE